LPLYPENRGAGTLNNQQQGAVPKKVLITGISGLVGSSVFLHLKQWPDRYDLYGLGRRRALSERVPADRRIDLPEDGFFLCDIADMKEVQRAVRGMDVVVHMAADPAGRSWDSLLSANIIGAYNIFEASLQAGVSRIVAASTIQVSSGHCQQEPYRSIAKGLYEDVPDHFARIGVEVAAEPRNLYAATKVFCESLCRTYAYAHGMSCLAIRIGWVVGEDRPRNNRGDIWCSQRDIARLIQCCIDAPEEVRFDIFYGMSESKYRWVDLENALRRVGYAPQDRAEDRL